jgi:hypothetical protein
MSAPHAAEPYAAIGRVVTSRDWIDSRTHGSSTLGNRGAGRSG